MKSEQMALTESYTGLTPTKLIAVNSKPLPLHINIQNGMIYDRFLYLHIPYDVSQLRVEAMGQFITESQLQFNEESDLNKQIQFKTQL